MVLADLLRGVQVPVEASDPAQAEPIPSLLVLPGRAIQVGLRLQVLRIPSVQLLVLAPVDVRLELVGQAQRAEQPRRLCAVGTRELKVRKRFLDILHGLQMLCISEVRRLQVDAVLRFRNLEGLVPFPIRLVVQVENIISPTLLQSLHSVVEHVEMHRDGRELRIVLGLLACPERAGGPGVAHLPEALLRHIQPAGLHAHLRHAFPHALGFDALDALVGQIRVTTRQVVREIE
mmetsp:Transcript_126058/g.364767  ORF Transcript_126058/g.364767 Transcript_126058/m.364767 type:complete len:233 (-) Transcript_126058:2422-3120(-)